MEKTAITSNRMTTWNHIWL